MPFPLGMRNGTKKPPRRPHTAGRGAQEKLAGTSLPLGPSGQPPPLLFFRMLEGTETGQLWLLEFYFLLSFYLLVDVG